MNEPRVYKNSPATLIVIVVLFIFLIAGIVFGVGFDDATFIIPIALFALIIFGSVFIAVSAKTSISDEEITTSNIFGSRTIRWTELHRVSGRGYNIKLHNFDGDVTVVPNSGLPGYEEVVEFIGKKRPDLFSPQEYGEMRRGIGPFLMMGFVTILLCAGSIGLALSIADSPDLSFVNFAPLLIFVFIVIIFGATTLSIPRAVTLESGSLNLKYLFSEKTLRADEISFIQLGYTQTRNGKHYYIALHLTNRKNIRLSGLGVSLPIAYLTLKNWHQINLHGQSANQRASSLNNIAPNWSDNSKN